MKVSVPLNLYTFNYSIRFMRFFVSTPLKIYFYGQSSLLRYDSKENFLKNNKSIVELNN